MGNVPTSPNQLPGQNINPSPQPSSDVPGLPPGTFEYVDTSKKRNWLRIIEICAVIIVISIPIVLTLFKKDYSFERTYAVLNPASFVTSPSYSPWSSFVTTAKKIIQPETATKNQENKESNVLTGEMTPTNTPTSSPEPTIAPTKAAKETIYPTLSQKQIDYINQIEEQNNQQNNEVTEEEPTPSPTIPYIFYPSEPPIYESDEEEEDAEPTLTPTITPTPPSSPYVACRDKQIGNKCSYMSNGIQIDGKCKQSNGIYLICVKQ